MKDPLSIDREVALYADDSHELSVLRPIGDELERRGARVRTAASFEEPAEIGLYSAHTSRFFDFDSSDWRPPANALSVQTLHDFGDNGADSEYFSRETWHIFDLGLLPGPEWEQRWQRAYAAGTRGPALGMRVVGWPKMDHLYSDPKGFESSVRSVRRELGVGERPVVLLACSWSDRRQLRETLALLDPEEVDVVVKYPASWHPSPGSPWEKLLKEAYFEMKEARAEAIETPGVIVADDDADIMALLAVSDVVLSDGSNVLYEGVLAGIPGISIKDWHHPAGRHGELTIQPRVSLSGVVSGSLASLPTMLRVIRDPAWSALVRESADALVDPATLGTAAARAADAIADALRDRRPLDASQLGEREIVADSDDALTVVLRQLKRTEAQLDATKQALKQADEREIRAREQLARWEQELTTLRAKVQRGSRPMIRRRSPRH